MKDKILIVNHYHHQKDQNQDQDISQKAQIKTNIIQKAI